MFTGQPRSTIASPSQYRFRRNRFLATKKENRLMRPRRATEAAPFRAAMASRAAASLPARLQRDWYAARV